METLLFGLIILALLALLILQSFLANKLGVQFDQTGISFPRRALRGRRSLALWRKRVSLDNISRIDNQSERTLRLWVGSGEREDVRFADRSQKLQFLEMFKARRRGRDITEPLRED